MKNLQKRVRKLKTKRTKTPKGKKGPRRAIKNKIKTTKCILKKVTRIYKTIKTTKSVHKIKRICKKTVRRTNKKRRNLKKKYTREPKKNRKIIRRQITKYKVVKKFLTYITRKVTRICKGRRKPRRRPRRKGKKKPSRKKIRKGLKKYFKKVMKNLQRRVRKLKTKRKTTPKGKKGPRRAIKNKIKTTKCILKKVTRIYKTIRTTKSVRKIKRVCKKTVRRTSKKKRNLKKKYRRAPKKKRKIIRREITKNKVLKKFMTHITRKVTRICKGRRRPRGRPKRRGWKKKPRRRVRWPKGTKVSRKVVRYFKKIINKVMKKVVRLRKKRKKIPRVKKRPRRVIKRQIKTLKYIFWNVSYIYKIARRTQSVRQVEKVCRKDLRKTGRKTKKFKVKLRFVPKKKRRNVREKVKRFKMVTTYLTRIYRGVERIVGGKRPRGRKPRSKDRKQRLILKYTRILRQRYKQKLILLKIRRASIPKANVREQRVVSRKIRAVSFVLRRISYVITAVKHVTYFREIRRIVKKNVRRTKRKVKKLGRKLKKAGKKKSRKIQRYITRLKRATRVFRTIYRRVEIIRKGQKSPKQNKPRVKSVKTRILKVIKKSIKTIARRTKKVKKVLLKTTIPARKKKNVRKLTLYRREYRRLKSIRRVVLKRTTVYSLRKLVKHVVHVLKRKIRKERRTLQRVPKKKRWYDVEKLISYQRRRTSVLKILDVLNEVQSRPVSPYEKVLIQTVSARYLKKIRVNSETRVRGLHEKIRREKNKNLDEIERFSFEIQFHLDVIHYVDSLQQIVDSSTSFGNVRNGLSRQVRLINTEISTAMKKMNRKFTINRSKIISKIALLRREKSVVYNLIKKIKVAEATRRNTRRDVLSLRDNLIRYIRRLHNSERRRLRLFRKAVRVVNTTEKVRQMKNKIRFYSRGVRFIRMVKMILAKTRSVRRFGNKLRRLHGRLLRRKRTQWTRRRHGDYIITVHKIWIVRKIRERVRVGLIIRRILRQLRRYKRITVKQEILSRRRESKSFRPNSKISRTLMMLVHRKERIARTINRVFKRLGRRDRRRLLQKYELLRKIITQGIRVILRHKKDHRRCCADILKAMKHCHCCHRCCYNRKCCNKRRSCPPGYYLTRSRGRSRCVKRCSWPYKRYFYKGKWFCRRPCQLGYKRYGPHCKRLSCPRGFRIQIRMKKVFCVRQRCPKGFFRVKGKGTCIKIRCPKGFKRVKGKCIAKKCKPGYKKLVTKLGAVCVRKVCARGYKLNINGDCVFDTCPKGYTKKTGKSQIYCIKKKCKPGYRKYRTRTGKTLCVKIVCPVGHKLVKGRCEFYKCPRGKTSLRVGKRVFCVKKTCPDGRLLNKHNKCVKCPVGFHPVLRGNRKHCEYRGCPMSYYRVGRGNMKQCIRMPRCYYPFVRKWMAHRWTCVKFRCPRFFSMRKGRAGRPHCVRISCPLGYRFSAKRGCLFRSCPKGMATVPVGKRMHCVPKCATGYRRKQNTLKCMWYGCPRGFNMIEGARTKYCVKVTCHRGYKKVKRHGNYVCVQIVCKWGYKVKGSKCVLYKCRKGSTMAKGSRGKLYCKKKTCQANQMRVSQPDGTVYCVPTGCGPNQKMIDGQCMAVGKMDIEQQTVARSKKATLKTIAAQTVTKSTIKTVAKGITIMTNARMKIVCRQMRRAKIGRYVRSLTKSMRVLRSAVKDADVKLGSQANSIKMAIQMRYNTVKTMVNKLLHVQIRSVVRSAAYQKIIRSIRQVRKMLYKTISKTRHYMWRAREKKLISHQSYVSSKRRIGRAKVVLKKVHKVYRVTQRHIRRSSNGMFSTTRVQTTEHRMG